MPRADGNSVQAPVLGLYLDRPESRIPEGGFASMTNARVRNGRLTNANIGWAAFPDDEGATALDLDSLPVMLVAQWRDSAGTQYLIFANTRDLWLWDNSAKIARYITPSNNTGTIAVTNGSKTVTGTGTNFVTDGVKQGDLLSVGSAAENDPAATWVEVDGVDTDTQITLTSNYAGSTVSGAAFTIRKLRTGAVQDIWFWDTFHDVGGNGVDKFYVTNGKEPVAAWAPGDVFATGLGKLQGDTLDFTCKWLRAWQNAMVYGNVDEDLGGGVRQLKPFSVRISTPGDPETVTGGASTSLQITDGPEPLIAAEPLGDALAIYSLHSEEAEVAVLRRTEAPISYDTTHVPTGSGPISGRAIVSFGTLHQFLSKDGLIQFDGTSAELVEEHVFGPVSKNIITQRASATFAHIDENNGENIWGLPEFADSAGVLLQEDGDNLLQEDGDDLLLEVTTEAATFGLTVHYREEVPRKSLFTAQSPQPVSARDLLWTSMGYWERENNVTMPSGYQPENQAFYSTGYRLTLAGAEDGTVYILNAADTANGTALNCSARTGRFAIGEGRWQVWIRRLYLFLAQNIGSITVNFYGADTSDGPLSAKAAVGYDQLTMTPEFLNARFLTRFLSWELVSDDGVRFDLAGWDQDLVRGGRR